MFCLVAVSDRIHIQTKTMSLLDQGSFQFCFKKLVVLCLCVDLTQSKVIILRMGIGLSLCNQMLNLSFLFLSLNICMKTFLFLCVCVQSPFSVIIILHICAVSDFLHQMLYFQSSCFSKLESSNPTMKFLFSQQNKFC